jgi:nucleoside-triphosphatase THEP1
LRCAVILHAPIGGGKTTTAEVAAERAKVDGLKVMGILSKRIFEGGKYPSYEIVELDTGEKAPLVKPAEMEPGKGWESYGNPHYVFSKKGFYSANLALHRAAEELRDGVVVFVDEYGRLESQHKGIHPGAVLVANALKRGGVAIYLCREDKVHEVIDLVRGRAVRVFKLEAGDADALLRIIRDCSKL